MQLAAIALISAAILAYEVLLARLFSIIQWYHFAYMVISIALLGYGASGTFVALARDRLMRHAGPAFALLAALFGVSAIACFALAQRLPFNPLEIVWDPTQLLLLLALYGLLTVPFFCGAACIGLALACFEVPVGRIYRADLLGAGAGALGIVALLFVMMPDTALKAIGALALAAAALASLAEGRQGRPRALAFLVAALAVPALPDAWTALQLSPYKGLRQALQVPGAVIETERSSPLGLLSAVRSPKIPFRHVPGLSLNNTIEPPAQVAVFTDGDGLSPITAFDGGLAPLAYLDLTTSALPYHLLERPEVLILGAGGGADVLSAVWHGAARIDAVELNPQFASLVRDSYGEFAGGLYDRPEVHLHIAEARGFVAGTERRFDLIALPLLDSFAASAGSASLHASFVYTVEAIGTYLDHLKPDGYLTITRWLKLPPRDSLKLLLTAITALEARGVAEPGRQLALIRGWDTTTLLVKNGVLTQGDVEQIRSFTQERSFDPVHHPGIGADEVNRYNVLQQPSFYEGAQALLGPDREGFVARYKFDLRPATDDRPYFFDFFTWRALPEVASLAAQSGPALLDWGYLILFATLVQAAVASALLVLLPLWLWSPIAPSRQRALAYRPLFHRHRACLPVRRDRIDSAVHPVPQPSPVCDRRRARGISSVRGAGQRPCGWARAEAARARRTGRAAARGRGDRDLEHRLCVRPAVPVRTADGAARCRQDRAVAGADRTARSLHGHAVPAGAGPAQDAGAGLRALGLGHQRLRLGGERDPRHPADHRARRPGCGTDRRSPLPDGRRARAQVGNSRRLSVARPEQI